MSQGQVVAISNYFKLFNGILNPKQLEGVRLLVTPFPQQQFNATEDRRSLKPSTGVTCFDCHVNGHTNGATHLVGAAVGGAVGGLTGALVGMGIPEYEAKRYEKNVSCSCLH